MLKFFDMDESRRKIDPVEAVRLLSMNGRRYKICGTANRVRRIKMLEIVNPVNPDNFIEWQPSLRNSQGMPVVPISPEWTRDMGYGISEGLGGPRFHPSVFSAGNSREQWVRNG